MIHVVVMKCVMLPFNNLVGVPLLIRTELYEGVGVRVRRSVGWSRSLKNIRTPTSI
jgi:hypothetical protein